MNGRIVISSYKPKPGKEAELQRLMATHLSRLRDEELVTDRESIVMKSDDGTILEVFEWKSKDAIERAHSNPAVLQMWSEFAEVCEFVPASRVAELSELFAEFTPIN